MRTALAACVVAKLIILNIRNGMLLVNLTGNVQPGVIGALLILSVLIPNLVGRARTRIRRL